jgi:hypothetical protein
MKKNNSMIMIVALVVIVLALLLRSMMKTGKKEVVVNESQPGVATCINNEDAESLIASFRKELEKSDINADETASIEKEIAGIQSDTCK